MIYKYELFYKGELYKTIYEIPDGKWQSFKAKYFPEWLKRYFPVKTISIEKLFDETSGTPTQKTGMPY